jgi:hypothetical protein
MIIRRNQDSFLCIAQPDHAALAAELMSHWVADGFASHPRKTSILLATREHDGGWIEEDAQTHVDASGEPLDFVSVPAAVKHRIWPRGVARLSKDHPYQAALIAQHALTVHGQLRADPIWRSFFQVMDTTRAELLSRCGDLGQYVEEDYRFVQTGDQLSLIFCNGWTAPFPRPGGRALLIGTTLQITPDPFAGARVPLRVIARRISARQYASAADLRDTLRTAPQEWLEGVAVGSA